MILHTFISRDVGLLVRAYGTDIRRLVEYNSIVWSPHTVKDIEAVKRIFQVFINTAIKIGFVVCIYRV